eukprot:jgi/Ulvmu1/7428/UM036_0089.1
MIKTQRLQAGCTSALLHTRQHPSSIPVLRPLKRSTLRARDPELTLQRSAVTNARRSARKGGQTAYHEQRARHSRAAQNGSTPSYWATWRRWPPFKTVSNLKFLSSLYDVHRLDIDLLDQVCPHVHDALAAQAASFTSDEASRAILYLSRLHMVPSESLWAALADRIDVKMLPSVDQGRDAASSDNSREKLDSKQSGYATTKSSRGSAQRSATAAWMGILHSLSVLRMLASGGAAGNWTVSTAGGLQLHYISEQASNVRRQWSCIPTYLTLPPAAMAAAVASWRSVNKHASDVDGVWLPLQSHAIQHCDPLGQAVVPHREYEGDETHQGLGDSSSPPVECETEPGAKRKHVVRGSPFERSVMAALQSELDVPILQEAVLEGSYVSVDMGVVGRGRTWRRGDAVFVAVEAQGPQHFVTKRAAEKRSSVVKRLLRQHAGWDVVAVGYREWRKAGVGGQKRLLRERLDMLPARCWRDAATRGSAAASSVAK